MVQKTPYVGMAIGLVALWTLKAFFPTVDTGFVIIVGLAIFLVVFVTAIAAKLLPLYVRKVQRDRQRRGVRSG